MNMQTQNEMDCFVRDGKRAAEFEVHGVNYKVLSHKVDGKWQYYVKTRDCESVMNLNDDIFNQYNYDPVKIARRIDYELSDIYAMVSEHERRPN